MQLDRRGVLKTLVAIVVGARSVGPVAANEHDHGGATLNRFATTAAGAEITGLFVTDDGRLFFNVQDPNGENVEPFDRAVVGGVSGVSMTDLPSDFASVTPSETDEERGQVRLATGEYQILAGKGDETDDGKPFGVPTTPDGTPLPEVSGSEEKPYGTKPDFNAFVPAGRGPAESGGDHTAGEGYLFSNHETKPGLITRLKLARETRPGAWTVSEVANLEEPLRAIGGTDNNCFGTRSPDGVPLSGEEHYAHRVTRFWNRPRPASVPESPGVDDDIEDADKLASVEKFALWLGGTRSGEAVDVPAEGEVTAIEDAYPNPYRLGYAVALENPAAADPADVEPRKLWTIGRAAHENVVVMADRKTAYASSDGTGKCFYKFVADDDVAGQGSVSEYLSKGTLYVAKAAQDGETGGDPSDVSFDIEWLELGHASRAELESWIAEYDDVTQADYLSIPDRVEKSLDGVAEIDAYVEEHGNPNYVTKAEIAAWANQYESRGPGGVDEELRRVPFLEARDAARAIGATAEFRKMEGVNVRPDAVAGEDALWVAMSNTNGTMSDDEGDIQLDGDGWGAVYRLPLEADYDVRRMVPEVVGGENATICGGCPYDARPDSASTVCQDCAFNPIRENEDGTAGTGLQRLAATAVNSLVDDDVDPANTIAEPDNIAVMTDGRVLIGEDTNRDGHENDNMLWVYDPGDGTDGTSRY